ncbi:MAG TPA: carboxypeptidase regulatory-like domain-containing protein, partial [Acidobacteriota bacterium]|nr:carboxypeptidase regulatory-like domain-containing protein [Acidobacteriota bacterium]
MYYLQCCAMQHAAGRRFSFALLVSLLFILLTGAIWAQSTSSITGVIRDSSNAVIPGAEVVVSSLATGSSRQAVSSETGTYRVTNLPPGAYTVSASMAGFKTTVAEVEVTVGEIARVELTLELGEITEQVIVDNAATPVDVEQGRVSSLVDERRIQDLPLNGRNVYQLMQLTPGAVNTEATVFEFGQSTNVNGGRTNMNGFWMDGITSTGLSGGTGLEEFTGAQPSLEAIQEFRIETLNFSAEFGNSAASIVNVVSKSGSNELHGSVYWFHRNDALDAREFFDEEKPPYRHNQFGFSLGGPIVKDKTFFFGSYEGTRIQTGESRVQAFESRAWSGYVARHGEPVASFLYANHPAPELDKVRTTVGQYLTENGRYIDEAPWWVPYIDSPDQASVDAFLSETFGSAPGDLSAEAPM